MLTQAQCRVSHGPHIQKTRKKHWIVKLLLFFLHLLLLQCFNLLFDVILRKEKFLILFISMNLPVSPFCFKCKCKNWYPNSQDFYSLYVHVCFFFFLLSRIVKMLHTTNSTYFTSWHQETNTLKPQLTHEEEVPLLSLFSSKWLTDMKSVKVTWERKDTMGPCLGFLPCQCPVHSESTRKRGPSGLTAAFTQWSTWQALSVLAESLV